jgi:hypothetical protein
LFAAALRTGELIAITSRVENFPFGELEINKNLSTNYVFDRLISNYGLAPDVAIGGFEVRNSVLTTVVIDLKLIWDRRIVASGVTGIGNY